MLNRGQPDEMACYSVQTASQTVCRTILQAAPWAATGLAFLHQASYQPRELDQSLFRAHRLIYTFAIEIALPLTNQIYLVSLEYSRQTMVNKGFRTSRILTQTPTNPTTLFMKSLGKLVKVLLLWARAERKDICADRFEKLCSSSLYPAFCYDLAFWAKFLAELYA